MSLSAAQREHVVNAITNIPAFRDSGVAYSGQNMCQILHESTLPDGIQSWVILEEVDSFPDVIFTDSQTVSANDVAPAGQPSNIGSEVGMMVLSCGSAILAGAAATSGVAAAPLTGGGSLALTVLAYAGAVASAAQCGISIGRVFNELTVPVSNDILDSSEWYTTTADILDGVALAGGLASFGQAAQSAIRLSRTSGRPLRAIIRGMNRAERKRLAQDIARYTGRAETRRQFLRLARSGAIPRIFSRQEINRAVLSHLLESIGYALTITGSSAYGGLINQHVLVHLFQQEPR